MEKHRAIPEGFMRIGEIARKAGVTVRTLSYYDKEGLLSPSAESEGGYRLYTDKDFVKLIQILMMKRLGFTLGEIKKRIVAMETTDEVIDVLTEHAINTRREIDHLTESLDALESLKAEITQMDSVDFKKFAGILAQLQLKNERYWLVKYLDDDVLDSLVEKNDASNKENAARIIEVTNGFIEEAAKCHEENIVPDSVQGKDFAERYWKWLMEVTGGDIGMVHRIAMQMTKSTSDEKHDEIMEKARLFMESSLESYFDNGFNAEATALHDDGVLPGSEQGQDFAERFWKWMMELSGGDIAKLEKMNEQFGKSASADGETNSQARLFIESSLKKYFSRPKKGGWK